MRRLMFFLLAIVLAMPLLMGAAETLDGIEPLVLTKTIRRRWKPSTGPRRRTPAMMTPTG
jgi:hypothetical protein